MSLQQWEKNGWIRRHQTSSQEIAGLLAIVDRDLLDAQGHISADWQLGIAYNATLKLCTILMHASGYRPERNAAHQRTLSVLPLILGEFRKADADYLEACRVKRNTVEYDMAGVATARDASELHDFAKQLRAEVIAWLREHHAELLEMPEK